MRDCARMAAEGSSLELNRSSSSACTRRAKKCGASWWRCNTAGITMRGIDLNSFDDFVRQVLHPEGDRVGLPTLFFPMQRIERISLDEPQRLDSFDGRRVRAEGGPLAEGLSRAVRLTCANDLPTMATRIFTVPNQLTFLRLGFLPFFIILIFYRRYSLGAGDSDRRGADRRHGRPAGALAATRRRRWAPTSIPSRTSCCCRLLSWCWRSNGQIRWWLTILVLGRDVLILTTAAVILVRWATGPFPPSSTARSPRRCKFCWFSRCWLRRCFTVAVLLQSCRGKSWFIWSPASPSFRDFTTAWSWRARLSQPVTI